MGIPTIVITEEEKSRILEYSESHYLDLKAKEIAPNKLSRTLAAFANADGGELFIGISEYEIVGQKVRAWSGFSDIEAANGYIQIFDKLFPLGEGFQYSFLANNSERGLVLKIDVQKASDIIRASDGKFYKRRGAQNLPVESEQELHRLRLDKGLISFENETISVEVKRITDSSILLNFVKLVVPVTKPRNWMLKQNLIRKNKPTVAGVLLFDEEPQALLPKRCAIKIYRYKTLEAVRDSLAFDPITIEGCLYDQIKEAVLKTIEIVETIKILKDNKLRQIHYPFETLHEIITNAVLHRDYSLAMDIHIRIFDNRIEIESPGRLPGYVTSENILETQLARNGTIVRIINKFPNPPNKDVGEGLNTAFDAMRRLKLKDPIIEEREVSVVVHIRHEPLASPEAIIIEYLETHSEINNTKAREICYIGSENVVKRLFERMMKNGLIERIPDRKGKSTAYRRKL